MHLWVGSKHLTTKGIQPRQQRFVKTYHILGARESIYLKHHLGGIEIDSGCKLVGFYVQQFHIDLGLAMVYDDFYGEILVLRVNLIEREGQLLVGNLGHVNKSQPSTAFLGDGAMQDYVLIELL